MDNTLEVTGEGNAPRIMLSHWWKTRSAQRAIARAAAERRERLEQLKRKMAERKAEIARNALDWIQQ
jgi:hypothetical protein